MKAITKALTRKLRGKTQRKEDASRLERPILSEPIPHSSQEVVALSTDPIAVVEDGSDRAFSRSLSELTNAMNEFKENYSLFAQKNKQYCKVQGDIQQALDIAGKEKDIKRSAQIFSAEITSTMGAIEKKQELSKSQWTGKFANFVIKLYPVARLSLQLTSAIAGVCS